MSAQSTVDHRGLFTLAGPILVSMVSYSLLALVNSIWVGQLGTTELAAIGLSAAAVYLVQALPMGLMGGLRTLVANRTGAEDAEGARALAWDGLFLAGICTLASLPLLPAGPIVFRLLGGSDDVAPLAAGYYAWRVAASPLLFPTLALTSWLQGRGDTRAPMVANLAANAVNFVLDPVLVFGFGPIPRLGIEGAAIGAGIGQAVGLAWLAWRARGELGAPVAPDRARLAAVWRLGSPTGVQYLLDVASYSGLSALLAWSGDAHLAAHVIVVRLAMVSILPCVAIGEAVSVLVGQRLGAAQPAMARRALWLGVQQTVALMVALGAISATFPRQLTAIFGAAPEVEAIAVPILVLYAGLQVFDAVATVMFGALNGAGDTRFTMRMGLAAAWLVKVPVAVLLVRGFGLGALGVWLAFGAEVAFQLATNGWRVRGRRWLVAQARDEPVGAAVVAA